MIRREKVYKSCNYWYYREYFLKTALRVVYIMGSLFSSFLSFIWRFRLFASRFLSSKGRVSGDFLFGTWIAIALGISLWYWTVTNADSIVFRIIIDFISYLKTWADLRTLSLTSSQGWCQNLKRNTTARDEYCMDLFLFITELLWYEILPVHWLFWVLLCT